MTELSDEGRCETPGDVFNRPRLTWHITLANAILIIGFSCSLALIKVMSRDPLGHPQIIPGWLGLIFLGIILVPVLSAINCFLLRKEISPGNKGALAKVIFALSALILSSIFLILFLISNSR